MGNFSDKLYHERVMKRLSLRDVATVVGISPMYLSQLENGILPSKSEVIPKLAEYYNLDLEELYELLEDERKDRALSDAKRGDFKSAFAAARKSVNISNALAELLRGGL